jgi:hypothetical protein
MSLTTKHILKKIVPMESIENTKQMLQVLKKEPCKRSENEVQRLASYLGIFTRNQI